MRNARIWALTLTLPAALLSACAGSGSALPFAANSDRPAPQSISSESLNLKPGISTDGSKWYGISVDAGITTVTEVTN